MEVYSIEKNEWTSLKNCQGLPILKWPGACVFSMSPNEQKDHTEKKVFIVGGKLTEGPNHSLSQESFIVDLNTSEVELCSAPITTRFVRFKIFLQLLLKRFVNLLIRFKFRIHLYSMWPTALSCSPVRTKNIVSFFFHFF